MEVVGIGFGGGGFMIGDRFEGTGLLNSATNKVHVSCFTCFSRSRPSSGMFVVLNSILKIAEACRRGLEMYVFVMYRCLLCWLHVL